MPKYKIYDKVYEAETPDAARAMFLAENRPGFLEGLVSHFNQGLTLGSADEMVAGARKLFGGDYTQSMRTQQAQRDAFAAENPISAGIATGVGAITPVVASAIGGSVGGPPGAVAAASTTGGRALQMTLNALSGKGRISAAPVNSVYQAAKEGAKVGTPLGGIAGYASADPEAEGGRGLGSVTGAAGGAVLGGALGGLVQGGQQTIEAGRPVLQKTVSAVRQAFSGRGPAANAPAAGGVSGGNAPAPVVAQSMNPTAAEKKILEAMRRSGVSPEDAAARLSAARQAGVPLGLLDVGGEAVTRLGRSTRTLPGEGSTIINQALDDRAAGQSDRIIGFLEQGLGSRTTGNAGATIDDLLTQARSESGPLYRALRRFPEVNTPEMQSIFSTPAVRDIMQNHEKTLRMGGRRVNPMYDEEGNFLRGPTLKEIDMVKQTLDERLSPSYQRNATGRPQEGLDVTTRTGQETYDILRRRLLREAEQAPGGQTYSAARQAFAGPAQARDAFESGLGMPNKSTGLQDVIAGVGDAGNANFYRRGVVEALRNRVESMPDLTSQPNRVRAVAGSATDRSKLSAAALPEERALLEQRLQLENQGAQTSNVVRGGSQTADKVAEAVDDVASDFVSSAVSGGPRAALTQQIGNILNNLRGSVGQNTRAEVARQLTNFNDAAAQQRFIDRLIELQRRGELNSENVRRAAQAATISEEVR